MTIFNHCVADIEVDRKHVELALWDTGSDDAYDRVRALAYPDSHVILVGLKKDLRRNAKTTAELRRTRQHPVTSEEVG